METLTYTGPPIRIDHRLTTQFLYSRNFFHTLIKSGNITVKSKNRKDVHIPRKSYMLLDGDTIYIDTFLRYVDGIPLDESPARDINILHECDQYLVIHKPKGVLSHPTNTRNITVPSVVGALYHHYKNIDPIYSGPHPGEIDPCERMKSNDNYVRIVHRLDMDTDGYMILAKAESAYIYFKNLFKLKSQKISIPEKESVPLHKYYRAHCEISREGALFLQSIQDELPVYIQQIVTPNVPYTEPKMGISKITSVSYTTYEGTRFAQIKCEILTGRTHQVRCHLSDHGLPIVGDIRYGASQTGGYIHLTAYKLEFLDMYGEMRVFG